MLPRQSDQHKDVLADVGADLLTAQSITTLSGFAGGYCVSGASLAQHHRECKSRLSSYPFGDSIPLGILSSQTTSATRHPLVFLRSDAARDEVPTRCTRVQDTASFE